MAKLHLAQQLIDILWPVGSVYISTDAANPSTKFGGTWSQITGGFIYGTTATSGAKGGTGNTGTGTSTGKNNGNTGSTTLTVNQIPAHSHNYANRLCVWDASASGTNAARGSYGETSVQFYGWGSVPNTDNTGGGGGHTHTLNNHQHTIPYIECYVWKRTA